MRTCECRNPPAKIVGRQSEKFREMSDSAPDPKPGLHDAVMDRLKHRLGRIAEVMPPTRPVIYLDYPVHDNVGDLLIHQGADAFLEDYGYTVLGRFSIHDFCRMQSGADPAVAFKPSIRDLDVLIASEECCLALHGGGNLGDLWPDFQMFREMLIERYRAVPIVILPQSVHFADLRNRDRAADIFGRHGQLFTFVRDEESLRFVREDCASAGEIMPDMAHQLWLRPPFHPADTRRGAGTLVQRRRDKERRGDIATPAAAFDWHDLKNRRDALMLRVLRKWQSIDNPLRHRVPNYELWRRYRDRLINRAIDRFVKFERIDTDRLHGMILGALLRREVLFREGSYGKLHRYARLWLADSDRISGEQARRSAA
jgi:pyruvyl transferase EpsO